MFLKLYGDHSYKRKKERKKHLSLSFAFQTIHGILEKSRFCKDMAVKYDSRLRERVTCSCHFLLRIHSQPSLG
jgi:hypothetical protein